MSSKDAKPEDASNQADDSDEKHAAIEASSFISDKLIKNVVYEGKKGYKIKVRLTSYRSLPLSCIEKIELSVDGVAINPDDITFILNGYSHKLNELAQLRDNWWFILDYAELFVANYEGLSAGEHLVEGNLVTVEPYVTAGRFSFFHSSSKRLSVK